MQSACLICNKNNNAYLIGFTLSFLLFHGTAFYFKKYLTELRREKESFQQLIKDRAVCYNNFLSIDYYFLQQMAISVDKDISDKDESLFSKISQKVKIDFGMYAIMENNFQVIVDVREFRSALPSFLHRRNFDIVPVTLEVVILLFFS